MDVYHQVLHKLYEATDGKPGKFVDLIDLVRKLGLFGSYDLIFKKLSDDGWIAESVKPDFVGITPFGVAEARRAENQNPARETARLERARAANRAANLADELAQTLREFAADDSGGANKVIAKLAELDSAVALAIAKLS